MGGTGDLVAASDVAGMGKKVCELPKERLAKRENLREFRGLVTRRVNLVIDIGRKHPTFRIASYSIGLARRALGRDDVPSVKGLAIGEVSE